MDQRVFTEILTRSGSLSRIPVIYTCFSFMVTVCWVSHVYEGNVTFSLNIKRRFCEHELVYAEHMRTMYSHDGEVGESMNAAESRQPKQVSFILTLCQCRCGSDWLIDWTLRVGMETSENVKITSLDDVWPAPHHIFVQKCEGTNWEMCIWFDFQSICCLGDGNALPSVSAHTLNNSSALHTLTNDLGNCEQWVEDSQESRLIVWLSKQFCFQPGTKDSFSPVLLVDSLCSVFQ